MEQRPRTFELQSSISIVDDNARFRILLACLVKSPGGRWPAQLTSTKSPRRETDLGFINRPSKMLVMMIAAKAGPNVNNPFRTIMSQ